MAKQKIIPDVEIARMVLDAGFSGLAAPVMVAICLAESGGDAYCCHVVDRNPSSPAYLSIDRGICQINGYWHDDVTDPEALDPARALKHAHRIATDDADDGEWDFTPWAVWNNLRFLEFWPRAVAAVTAAQS